MKRFFFSLIALTAAVVGCTQSALLESPDLFGTEIGFNPYTGRTPVTKATAIEDESSLNTAGGFNVLGFITRGEQTGLYMDKAVDLEDGVWSYDGAVYWPDDNGQTKLAFAAYSSNVYGQNSESNTDDLISWTKPYEEFTYSVPASISKQIDLLATNYQTDLTLANNGADIDLQFNHLLSKVGFKLVANNNNEDIDVVIKSVIFEGTFPQTGSVNIKESPVEIETKDPTEKASYELLDIDANPGIDGCFAMSSSTAVTPIYVNAVMPDSDITEETVFEEHSTATTNYNNRFMMIMPHAVTTTTADKIKVVYQITDATQKTAEINLPTDLVFHPSKAYEFILKVSTSSIGFTVEEYNWSDGAGDETPYPVIPNDNTVKVTQAAATSSEAASVSVTVAKGEFADENTTIAMQYQIGTGNWNTIAGSSQNYDPARTDYSFSLTGLIPNQTYNLRAIVTSNGEHTYSSGRTITTLPVVETVAISDPESGVNVTLKGIFSSNNGNASVKIGFLYGTRTDANGVLGESVEVNRPGSSEEAISADVHLNPNTTYYYQTYASNAGGTTKGSIESFKTPVIPATVKTNNAEATGSKNAKLEGTLIANGGTDSTVGFIYGVSNSTNGNGAINGTSVEVATLSSNEQTFTAYVNNLLRFTTYYAQAYAINSQFTSYGEISAPFTTEAEDPIVAVQVSSYSAGTASFQGSVTDAGVDSGDSKILSVGFIYWADGASDEDKENVSSSISNNGFTKSLANNALEKGTMYYVQAYATNIAGKTGYSPIIQFETPSSDDPIQGWEPGTGSGEIGDPSYQ